MNLTARRVESEDWSAIEVSVKIDTTVVASPNRVFETRKQIFVVSGVGGGYRETSQLTLAEESYQGETDALEPAVLRRRYLVSIGHGHAIWVCCPDDSAKVVYDPRISTEYIMIICFGNSRDISSTWRE
jgi:hypothetical protein